MHPKTKLIIGGLALAAGVTYLGVTGARSGWVYFVDVDALVLDLPDPGQRVRVHGNVGTDNYQLSRADRNATFQLIGEQGGLIPVVYTGPVPDMFDVGRQVVVEGALDTTGTFHADVLMTKCASKYEGHGENGPERPGKETDDCPEPPADPGSRS